MGIEGLVVVMLVHVEHVEHGMTPESLSLGSLATRNLIVTNLHFVSQAIFLYLRAIFVTLRCNFVMFYTQN